MVTRVRWLAGCVAVGLLLIGDGASRGGSREVWDDMVVVLKTGGVLVGQIEQVRNGIRVVTEGGSAFDLKFDQVELLAADLADAHRQILALGDVHDAAFFRRHFDWALQRALWDSAEQMLVLGQAAGIDGRTMADCRSRLEKVRAQVDQPPATSTAAGRATSDTPPPAAEAIQREIARLPDGTEAFFNQRLQSKLVSSCATAGCHDRSHQGLALHHEGIGLSIPRGLSRRNLYQAIQWIDRAAPGESLLLERSGTPHGGAAVAGFAADSEPYRLLEYWAYSVSDRPEAYVSEVLQRGVSAPALSGESPRPDFVAAAESAAARGVDLGGHPPELPVPPAHEQMIDWQSAQRDAAPCDPEPFNRRFHPERFK